MRPSTIAVGMTITTTRMARADITTAARARRNYTRILNGMTTHMGWAVTATAVGTITRTCRPTSMVNR